MPVGLRCCWLHVLGAGQRWLPAYARVGTKGVWAVDSLSVERVER
jgi:hypothetical protein